MRGVAHEIGAVDEKYQAGIDLIGAVVQKYEGDPPFPIYAYTSKGPYILDGPSLDRLAACGASVLFKKRRSATRKTENDNRRGDSIFMVHPAVPHGT